VRDSLKNVGISFDHIESTTKGDDEDDYDFEYRELYKFISSDGDTLHVLLTGSKSSYSGEKDFYEYEFVKPVPKTVLVYEKI
jgi:hypothetical protein